MGYHGGPGEERGSAPVGIFLSRLDELPIYQSYKKVQGAHIVSIGYAPGAFRNGGKYTVLTRLPAGEMRRFEIEDGLALKIAEILRNGDDKGVLVRYEDGYLSWSPTKAFEDGYRRLSDFTGA